MMGIANNNPSLCQWCYLLFERECETGSLHVNSDHFITTKALLHPSEKNIVS